MKTAALTAMLMSICLLLSGCAGGQEIESCLFVLAMAVDPAPDGNLTVTVKALSGTQETIAGAEPKSASAQEQHDAQQENRETESPEPGYIVMSATAPSCLRALNMLSSTTPRTVNLSQLREVVINRTLAQTDATLSILKEIHSMYRANGEAVVVVTPDDAGDFIRRQRAILGVRLSKYLEVLFDHFMQMDTIPPDATLAAVIEAMESDTMDALAVYAAGNAFDSAIVLSGTADMDRLPGHLPRTSVAVNEYLGSALFSGARMTGVLTGEETGLLCLMMGEAQRRTTFIGNAQYKTNLPTRVRRSIGEDGALCVTIRMNLSHIAGNDHAQASEIAAQIEREAVNVLLKLRAASSDAVGFGRIAVRRSLTIDEWEAQNWPLQYESRPVRVSAHVRIQ